MRSLEQREFYFRERKHKHDFEGLSTWWSWASLLALCFMTALDVRDPQMSLKTPTWPPKTFSSSSEGVTCTDASLKSDSFSQTANTHPWNPVVLLLLSCWYILTIYSCLQKDQKCEIHSAVLPSLAVRCLGRGLICHSGSRREPGSR